MLFQSGGLGYVMSRTTMVSGGPLPSLPGCSAAIAGEALKVIGICYSTFTEWHENDFCASLVLASCDQGC